MPNFIPMQRFLFTTKKGGIDINHPTALSDITLRQWQEWVSLGSKEEDVQDLQEQANLILDIDDRTVAMAEAFIARLELARSRIQAIVPETEAEKLLLLNGADLIGLEASPLIGKDGTDLIARFIFPTGTIPDLDKAKAAFGSLGFFEKRRARKRMDEIKKGRFVVVPVAELEFRAKMALDRLQKSKAVIPDELKDWMEGEGLDVQQVAKRLMELPGTPEQERDRLKRTKLLNKYARELERNEFKNMHHLLSHLCVPEGMEYDPVMANERAPHFLELTMDIVEGVRRFFVAARKTSQLLTQTSFPSQHPQ